ncbi:kinase-like domain-containing protein [Thelephora terrestris]|uniref:Kinase-like domain-containing protein n=1 Tax=Thelephora terrestris TaxID=56493 RepID=A0A9P6L7E9_9AGAM|nr:kinase-like domain-containing protein [Thelephora terrestris]
MVQDLRESWKTVLNSVDEGFQSLVQISRSSEGRTFLGDLERGEAGLCIELLDRGLTKPSLDQATRQSVLIVLIRLSRRLRRLPNSVTITETDEAITRERTHISSSTWEVRRGTLNGSAIAIKTPRFTATTDAEKIRERFCREVILWNTLSHPNILKLKGVLGSINTSNFSTVTDWMPRETLKQYIEENDVNRLELLHGVARGLKYMHDLNLVHGGIKASNVLIANGSPPLACLSGFGSISSSDQEYTMSEPSDAPVGVAWRYLAPELIYPRRFGLTRGDPSKEADVYTFGLLVLEVLTGKVPFDGTKGKQMVYSIIGGSRPTKPGNATKIGLSDQLWEFLEACWQGDRTLRPQMQEVEVEVGKAAAPSETHMPPRRLVPFPLRPRDELPNPLAASSSSSSTGTSVSDQSRLIIPEIRIYAEGSEENEPYHMQEIYPPPPPISPSSQSESPSAVAEINRLDGALERGSVHERERAKVLNDLCKLCYRHQNVPESAKTVDCYDESMTVPVWSGENAKVFKGSYRGRPVAVKVVQLYADNREMTLRRFCKEAVIWRHLRHSNILPLVGVAIGPGRCSLVSNWMDNGTINAFIERNPDANRVDLLIDVVKGLMYMHKLPIVHGDLKGENILINQEGHACLVDFGLSTIVHADKSLSPSDPNFLSVNQRDSLMSFIGGGSVPWMSPELLEELDYRPTEESDVYALGMVIYEVLCGAVPFGDLTNSAAIVKDIVEGKRPTKPEDAAHLGFTGGLWKIVEQCWSPDGNKRPALKAVQSCLEEATARWGDRRRAV